MLPASLVQPVIVKNTFLDFDDSCLKRSSRRCKTEGAINSDSHAEPYYEPSSDSTLTSSPTSSLSQSSDSNSALGEGAEDISLPPAQKQQKLEQEWRRPVMLSEALETSMAQAGASTPAMTVAPTIHHWTIDAKKLRSNDRSVVSRPFTLAVGGPGSVGVTCKMMLYAKTLKQGKAGQSFKLSGGQGSLQLKCEHDLSGFMNRVSLRFFVGSGQESKLVHHNFSQSAACASQDWDFSKAVDKSTQTLVVSVEVMAH